MQLGTNEDEAQVFRARAGPEGLCENLIRALKLLANQQKDGDGDSPIQNIIMDLKEKCMGTYYERTEKLRCIGQSQCGGGGPPA